MCFRTFKLLVIYFAQFSSDFINCQYSNNFEASKTINTRKLIKNSKKIRFDPKKAQICENVEINKFVLILGQFRYFCLNFGYFFFLVAQVLFEC